VREGRNAGVRAHAGVGAGADQEQEGDEQADFGLAEFRGGVRVDAVRAHFDQGVAVEGECREDGAGGALADEGEQEGEQPGLQRGEEGACVCPTPFGGSGARASLGLVAGLHRHSQKK
jgi:hypothetical protein